MNVPDADARAAAVDPGLSCIVRAPAGSGKTTLLVQRYLHLLTTVNQPEEILAITFTRKAASEMRSRVLEQLNNPTSSAARKALQHAQQQGWPLLHYPNRLCIQTIDSFAMHLVRSATLDCTSLPPGATLSTSPGQLYQQAVDQLFENLGGSHAISPVLVRLLSFFDNHYISLREQLINLLGRREQWIDSVSTALTLENRERSELQESLQQARLLLNDQILESVKRRLGLVYWEALMDLSTQAHEQLAQDTPDLAFDLVFIANTWITKDNKLRKAVDRRQGFLPKTLAKSDAGQLLESLNAADLGAPLSNLRHMALASANEQVVDTLVDICVTLTFAANQLTQVFDERQEADFPALLIAAKRLLGRDDGPTELALALDYRLKHILVDEFQDTSHAQFEFFELLTRAWDESSNTSFFAVGDPMQSIYRFREADITTFYQALDQGIGNIPLQSLALSTNFRSDGKLVDWHNEAFARLFGKNDDPLVGQVAYTPATAAREAEQPQPTRYIAADTPEQSAQALVTLISELIIARPKDSIAILLRNRSHASAILPLLRQQEIAWRGTDMDPLADRPVVADLLTLHQSLLDPANKLLCLALLRCPLIGMDLEDLEVLASDENFDNPAPGNFSQDGQIRFQRFLQFQQPALKLLPEVSVRETLENAWLGLGGVDAYLQSSALDDAEQFFAFIDELGVKAREAQTVIEQVKQLYAQDTKSAQVEMLTIHKAKGLEWDHVFVPGLNRKGKVDSKPVIRWRSGTRGLLLGLQNDESLYPWLEHEERRRAFHELDRLLYVACTRARKSLYLFGEEPGSATRGTLQARLEPALDITPNEHWHDSSEPAADAKEIIDTSSYRLPADYRWQPPDPAFSNAIAEPELTNESIAERGEVCLGQLVHQSLEYIAKFGRPESARDFVSERMPLWHERLAQDAVPSAEWQEIIQELERQLKQVLADVEAGWIFETGQISSTARHALANSAEQPLLYRETTPSDQQADAVLDLVVDRITEDPQGTLWVVDYKSGRPGSGEAEQAFIQRETYRYSHQLRRYGAAVAAITGDPVKIGIYFTALPRFVVLDQG